LKNKEKKVNVPFQNPILRASFFQNHVAFSTENGSFSPLKFKLNLTEEKVSRLQQNEKNKTT